MPDLIPTSLAEDDLSTNELRRLVERRADGIREHLNGLRHELTTVADVNVAGRPVLDYVREHPWLTTASAVAGGALIGLLLGKRARVKARKAEASFEHTLARLVDQSRAVDLDGRAGQGRVLRALKGRPPVIIYNPSGDEKPSALAQSFQTLMGFGMKVGLDYLTKRFTGDRELFDAVKHRKGARHGL